MNKKIIIIVCVSFISLVLFFYFNNHTSNFRGVIVENNIERNTNITVKYKQINKVLNRMSGNVCIQEDDGKNTLEYKFSGPVFKGEDCDFTIVYRFYTKQRENPHEYGYESKYESKYEHGYMYFDKELKNVAVITSERQIYAANEKFINVIKNMTDVAEKIPMLQ